MRVSSTFLLGWLIAWGGLLAPVHGEERAAAGRSALVTVEGVVSELSSRPAEGELDVVLAILRRDEASGGPVRLLVAPRETLDEIGFPLQVGDRLRARAFVADDGFARAYKVLNLTRNSMVRFRSLRQVPLWDNRGSWQGGACRPHPQGMGAGGRGRGGGGGR